MSAVIFTHTRYQAEQLFPFSLTTSVEDIPSGMLTNRRRWELIAGRKLQAVGGGQWIIPANLLPSMELIGLMQQLNNGAFLQLGENGAVIGLSHSGADFSGAPVAVLPEDALKWIEFGWNIFEYNQYLLHFDFALLTEGRGSAPIAAGNYAAAPENIFIEEGASLHCCILNAAEGPIYISKGALIMEGTCIRGPVFIGPQAVVKMGAKLYGGTTVGACCTVGSEIKNSVLFPFSNKAHDGYLGDSVIGHWCNLGAGTSNSNLKNTAGNIKVILPSGTHKAGMKCGVLMGDYSKTAINTSINSGTVIGVCSNVFGTGLTPKLIPSFSWGFNAETIYEADQALEHVERWMQTKKQQLTSETKQLITNIYNQTKTKRS
ncbi:MAG: sugar-1-phosphate guanyl transferase [Niabella sp.]|nr:sugar-1-phosphate guanyl transferase [Niabella sp.]